MHIRPPASAGRTGQECHQLVCKGLGAEFAVSYVAVFSSGSCKLDLGPCWQDPGHLGSTDGVSAHGQSPGPCIDLSTAIPAMLPTLGAESVQYVSDMSHTAQLIWDLCYRAAMMNMHVIA